MNSEHVLLSLLRYDASTGRVPQELDASVEERGYAKGALAVFLRMEGGLSVEGGGGSSGGGGFSESEFCRRLVMDIKYPQDGASGGKGGSDGELVSGASKSSSTPTLSEVGTDLLMGEPGVGKTAIAEGVAQILAAPNMLDRLDELVDRRTLGDVVAVDIGATGGGGYDYGTSGYDDGDFVRQDQVDRIRELARLCPAKSRNHRVVSLELANLVAGTKYTGEFEERLQAIVEEVTHERAPPTILFIDG